MEIWCVAGGSRLDLDLGCFGFGAIQQDSRDVGHRLTTESVDAQDNAVTAIGAGDPVEIPQHRLLYLALRPSRLLRGCQYSFFASLFREMPQALEYIRIENNIFKAGLNRRHFTELPDQQCRIKPMTVGACQAMS